MTNESATIGKLRLDLTGGMQRPEAMLEARARRDGGELSDVAFQQIVDEAVRDLVDKEEAHGLPVVTDGEFRRHNFQESFGGAFSGFDAAPYVYSGPRVRAATRAGRSRFRRTGARDHTSLARQGAAAATAQEHDRRRKLDRMMDRIARVRG